VAQITLSRPVFVLPFYLVKHGQRHQPRPEKFISPSRERKSFGYGRKSQGASTMAAPTQLYISQSLELLTPPKTPPEQHVVHSWPEPETEREEIDFEIPWNVRPQYADGFNVPHQEVLLLHGPKQKYAHTREQPIPSLKDDREMLVQVEVVGLNPIDWKAPYVVLNNSESIADKCPETSDGVCQRCLASVGAILLGRW